MLGAYVINRTLISTSDCLRLDGKMQPKQWHFYFGHSNCSEAITSSCTVKHGGPDKLQSARRDNNTRPISKEWECWSPNATECHNPWLDVVEPESRSKTMHNVNNKASFRQLVRLSRCVVTISDLIQDSTRGPRQKMLQP